MCKLCHFTPREQWIKVRNYVTMLESVARQNISKLLLWLLGQSSSHCKGTTVQLIKLRQLLLGHLSSLFVPGCNYCTQDIQVCQHYKKKSTLLLLLCVCFFPFRFSLVCWWIFPASWTGWLGWSTSASLDMASQWVEKERNAWKEHIQWKHLRYCGKVHTGCRRHSQCQLIHPWH